MNENISLSHTNHYRENWKRVRSKCKPIPWNSTSFFFLLFLVKEMKKKNYDEGEEEKW